MYSHNVPGPAIWAFHISLGLFFIYIASLLRSGQNLPEYTGILFYSIGTLVIFYHAYLWYKNSIAKNQY